MRRALALLALTALAAIPATALGAAKKKKHHFVDHLVGAALGTQGTATTYAFKISSSDVGPGASVNVNTSTSSTTGTTHGTAYFATGSIRSAGTYSIGATDASGNIPVTVKGRNFGGTGNMKGVTGTFTGSGIDNTKTGIVTITVSGTEN